MPTHQNDTPAAYSREEARRIRHMVLDPGEWVVCPRCGDDLTVGQPVTHGEITIRNVLCPSCRRSVMVREPGQRENVG